MSIRSTLPLLNHALATARASAAQSAGRHHAHAAADAAARATAHLSNPAGAHSLQQLSKTLAERSIRLVSQQASHPLYKKASGAVEQHIRQNGVRSLQTLARRAREHMRRQGSTRDLIEALGGDIYSVVQALEQAMDQSDQEGDQEGQQACKQHLDAIREKHPSATEFEGGNQQGALRENIRTLYHQHLIKDTSPQSVLQSLLESGMETALSAGLHSLRQTLSKQLAARQPGNLRTGSQQQIELIMLQTAIRLSGALQTCHDVLSHTPDNKDAPTSATLLRQVIELITRGQGITPHQLQGIHTSLAGGKDERQQMSTFNRLVSLFQQMPQVLWRDEKTRQRDISTLRTMMDELTRGTARNDLGAHRSAQVMQLHQQAISGARDALEKFT